jgi:glycine cleavage system H protein
MPSASHFRFIAARRQLEVDPLADLSSYRFTKTHEWVATDGDDVTVGISQHAQQQLGDVIFVELPAVGTELNAGDKFGAVESVKAASDLYAPVSGTVAAVNTSLESSPELINGDPYGEGWMIRLSGAGAGPDLMDEKAYEALVG